jgi:hypothetical protein
MSLRRPENQPRTTQQMQLWIFWAIAAGIHNLRLHPHAETKKKATNGNLAASGAEQHVPVLTNFT